MRKLYLTLLLFVIGTTLHAQDKQVTALVDDLVDKALDSYSFRYTAGNLREMYPDSFRVTPVYDTMERVVHWYNRPDTVVVERFIRYYNSAGMADSVYEIVYGSAGTFNYSNAVRYSYDAAGNDTGKIIVRSIVWPPDFTDTVSVVRKTYTAGMLTETEEKNKFTASARTRYTYAGGYLVVLEKEGWKSGAWQYETKRKYSYDAVGNMLTDTAFAWNNTNSVWDTATISVYTWNALNQQQSYELHRLAPGAAWNISRRENYVYNAAGLRLYDTARIYFGGVLRPETATTYAYNAKNEQDSATMYKWNIASGMLEPNAKYYFSYNAIGSRTLWQGKIWNAAGAEWVLNLNRRYHYKYVAPPEDTTTGIAMQQHTLSISLYPNPANDFITLKLDNRQPSTIAIYTTTGALLRQWEEKAGNTTRTIPLHGFETGNYILAVRGADGSQVSRQFVVGH